jgi:hypothetical protein
MRPFICGEKMSGMSATALIAQLQGMTLPPLRTKTTINLGRVWVLGLLVGCGSDRWLIADQILSFCWQGGGILTRAMTKRTTSTGNESCAWSWSVSWLGKTAAALIQHRKVRRSTMTLQTAGTTRTATAHTEERGSGRLPSVGWLVKVHWSSVIPNVGRGGLWTAAVKSDDVEQTGEDGYGTR